VSEIKEHKSYNTISQELADFGLQNSIFHTPRSSVKIPFIILGPLQAEKLLLALKAFIGVFQNFSSSKIATFTKDFSKLVCLF
jgi:hypothetical protein